MKHFFSFWAVLFMAIPSFAQPTTLFFDDFETAQFGPKWSAIPNLNGINGVVEVTTGSPFSGQYAAWLGKNSDLGGLTTNALDLRINLQGQNKVELTFQIHDYNDETQAEDGLYFSNNNGATFKKVLDFKPSDWCDYQWGQFPPIEVHKLAAQNGLTLNSQFVIRFQQRGERDFSGNVDGIGLDDVHVYVPCTAYFPITASTPFFDDFEIGKLGCNWAWRFANVTNTLAAIPTRPSNYVGATTTPTFSGQYAIAMGKTCEDGFATNALDLHLNLQGQQRVELTFQMQHYTDESQVDDGIYFSDNAGESFKKVFSFRPGDWCDYQWGQYPPIEIHKLAAKYGLILNNQFIIRFQQHDDQDFSGNTDGFVLDDVHVYVPCTAYFPVTFNNPFFEDFETGKLGCNWAWRFSDTTNTLAAVPTRPSNFVGTVTNPSFSGQYALAMGKTCEDGFATNALDLHLNLQGQQRVELSFQIQDYNDETQVDDGIYFSDNGGASFKKVFSFRPGDWCDYKWGQYPPIQVHKLAAQNGLNLTSQFIIRFQQHDDQDFSGNVDGLIFDDIRVYVPELEYAPIPFEESFETGAFRPMWAWRFAEETALPATNVTRPSNYVAVEASNTAHTGQYSVPMGKLCDDGFATNALDLHLNLAGKDVVKLSFWINVWAEETQIQDGIWFSNNGGQSFTKVYGFNFENVVNYQYYQISLDVVALAIANDIPPTSQFIIRFQQHDDMDFYGQPDGFILDDINVTEMTSATEETALNRIGIFPNPVSDVLWINNLPNKITHFRVLDFQGRVIQSGTLKNELKLATGNMPTGVYFLECRQESEIWQGRFVKQ